MVRTLSVTTSAGDVDGDGKGDLLFSSYPSSKAYLFLGGKFRFASSVDISQAEWFTGENASDIAGYSVSGSGDVDGDGLDDILIETRANDENGMIVNRI